MEARAQQKIIITAKTPPINKFIGIGLRISQGPGMLGGGTIRAFDSETGTTKCGLTEGQEVQVTPDNLIIAPECFGCFVRAYCLAVARSRFYNERLRKSVARRLI